MLLLLGRRRSRSRRVCRRFRCVIVGVVGRDARSRLRRRRRVSTARLWLLLLLRRVLTLLAPAHLALVGARQHVFLVPVLGAAHWDRRSCCCRGALRLLVLLLLRRILGTSWIAFIAASLLRRLLGVLVSRIPRVVDDLVDRRLWFFSLGLRLSIVITRLCGLALPRLRGRRAARLGAAALHRRSRNRRRFRRHPIGTLPTRLPRLKHVPPPFLHALRLPLHLLHERLPRRPNLEVAPTLDAIQLGQQPRQPFFVPMNGGVGRVVFELGCVQGGSRLEDELGGGRRGELSLEVLKPGGEFVEFLQPLRALVDDGFLLFLLLGLIFLCSLAWWLGLLLLVRSRRR